MFDNKGQSALEYLMTYGWALIVIAIVIGVLIFVTSGATGGVTCQSQSTGLVLKEWAVTQSSVGVTLQNATGGTISVGAASAVAPFVGAGAPNPVSVPQNQTFTVTGMTGPVTSGAFSNAGLTIDYNTAGGLPAQATIVCSGTV